MRSIDGNAHVRRLALARVAANDSRIAALNPMTPAKRSAPQRLSRLLNLATRWPLQALLAWASAWGGHLTLQSLGAPAAIAALGATGLGALWMLAAATSMRRAIVVAGFPLSLLASGAAPALATLPAWGWLLPLALLAWIYPASAWRDAPLFPTPAGALDALARHVPLAAGARVHDAGCGLGHGLAALRRAYPHAQLDGIERSAPVAWAAALRARRAGIDARVRRGDMWAADWRGCALVYLFQRPESLPRAVAKARAELAAGAWLASLEFPAIDLQPDTVITCPDGRALWLYRAPFTAAAVTSSSASLFTPPATERTPRAWAARRQRR
jgi:SAM-dependent methyltransferase